MLKRFLNTVSRNAVDAVVVIDAGGTIRAFNPAAERIFGYPADDVIGTSLSRLMPEPHRSAHPGYLANYLSTGEVKVIGLGRELTAQRADGTIFPMELGVSEVKLPDDHFFVGFVRDISQREEAERALREKTAHLQAVLDTVADGLITIDESGVLESLNAAAEKIFGYTAAEAVGQSVQLLIPEPHPSGDDGYWGRRVETAEDRILGGGREVTARRKNGSAFPIDLAVTEMSLQGRRRFVAIIRDITSRRAVEDEKANLISTLKRSNQELDDFAYIASHDLKEPLRGLYNNALFLREDHAHMIDAAGLKRIDRICFLAQRMERLIDDLLYYSRLGRQGLAMRPTNLEDVVQDVWDQMEASKRPGATLRLQTRLPVVVCDAVRVGEVFRNLFTNAIKYNRNPEKTIDVGTLDGEFSGHRAFFVKDNGIGIPRDFHDDVFTLFKRLQSESDGVRGSGVGLTFAKKIVERHGGKMWLESEAGRGSTFYFTIEEGVERGDPRPGTPAVN